MHDSQDEDMVDGDSQDNEAEETADIIDESNTDQKPGISHNVDNNKLFFYKVKVPSFHTRKFHQCSPEL